MIKQLRLKFIIATMLIVTIMLCVIFSLIYYFTKTNLEQNSISMMQSIAINPFQLEHPNGETLDVQLPYFTLQVNDQGELISVGGGYYDLSDENLLQELIDQVLSSGQTTGTLKEYNLRFYQSEFLHLHVLIFADISSEVSTLNHLIRTCAIIGTLSFLLFLMINLFLSYWISRPVAEAWQQQKRFVADASHELKTPLTVISTNAEILLNSDYDQSIKAQCADRIMYMSAQMRSLVEGLLDLAKADQIGNDMFMERLDLSQTIKDAILPFEAVFFEQGLDLIAGIHPRIYIKGSQRHLEQLISILLDNAQKYSLHTKPVYIKLWLVGRNRCRFTISNPCHPVNNEQLQDIFKRFYRIDKDRTSNGSYGLGLSIAERIVIAHKGKIWASYQEDIITFSVEFPVCR